MGAKHTPGPWDYDYGLVPPDGPERYCEVTKDGGNLIIARVNDCFNEKEGHANARLIAAAPMLLEACERMKEAINLLPITVIKRKDIKDCLVSPYRLIVAAIAAARGE